MILDDTLNDNLLFIDKYKPKTFEEIKYSNYTDIQLKSLAKNPNFPHIILKGFRGSGKKTRALLFLKEKYAYDNIKLDTFNMECKVLNKTEPLILSVLFSPYHYQINLSSYGVYDRILLEFFFKEIINYKSINNLPYRIIIIEDTDNLSIEAQQSLRRTLETKINNSRFIFIVNNEGFLMDPLYSRCITIPVLSPDNREIFNVIHPIALKEELIFTNQDYNDIINNSNRNMHTAISIINNYKITKKIIKDIDINEDIIIICNIIIKCTKIDYITLLREKLNNLLINNLTKNQIFKSIFKYVLLKNKNKDKIHKLIKISSKYDLNLKKSGKNIYHLEGYCIALIDLFK